MQRHRWLSGCIRSLLSRRNHPRACSVVPLPVFPAFLLRQGQGFPQGPHTVSNGCQHPKGAAPNRDSEFLFEDQPSFSGDDRLSFSGCDRGSSCCPEVRKRASSAFCGENYCTRGVFREMSCFTNPYFPKSVLRLVRVGSPSFHRA